MNNTIKNNDQAPRIISITDNNKTKFDFFKQWEFLLIALFVFMNIVFSILSPYYLDFGNLLDATNSFLDKAFIVLPMAFIIILGCIDISVAATVALSSVIMAVSFNAGVPMPAAMLICLCVGTICGFINGFLLTKFHELAPMIVTLATQIIYRGIASIILEDRASGGFPPWFAKIGWGSVGVVPYMFIAFVFAAIIFSLLLHKTTFGRKIYAMGSNVSASEYSGIRTKNVKLIVYTLAGFMAAVTAIFLTSRMGSTRPNLAVGFEMEVIAMVVLGGISTAGGKGKMSGVVLSVFLIGLFRYGMGMLNKTAQEIIIWIGLILVIAVALPTIKLIVEKKIRNKK